MYFSMICRERPRINMMASVPQDFLTVSGGTTEPYALDWISALRTYWRGEPGFVDILLRAMQGTESAALRVVEEDYALQLGYPVMEMFYLLTQREDAKFNESLAKALELHKRYYTERAGAWDGFVAWAPLAIACLAKDMGVAIEVESDYLPANLLEGTWVGERTI
jgi:immunity protein 49 of polymorphic toxin system